MSFQEPRRQRPRPLPRDEGRSTPPVPPHPGARPLSARQRAHRAERPADVVWSRGSEDAPRGPKKKRPRTQMRRRNRRRRDIPRILLRLSLALLLVECVAVLLFSPRLWVRTVRIEGNRTVAAERLFHRMRLLPQTNIVRLPVGRIRARVAQEPAIASVEVHRRLPGTVVLLVRERVPWAVVKTGGVFYTVDKGLVPFRQARAPEAGLPLVTLEGERGSPPRLGKQMIYPGLPEANICLHWALSRPNFPLAKIGVDQSGKLCLNREGGAEVRLGSGMDLDKKLNALASLLVQRDDLKAGNFVYVNLYAFDAPAILTEPPLGG